MDTVRADEIFVKDLKNKDMESVDTVRADDTFVKDLKNKDMESFNNLQHGCVEDVYEAINTYKALRLPKVPYELNPCLSDYSPPSQWDC